MLYNLFLKPKIEHNKLELNEALSRPTTTTTDGWTNGQTTMMMLMKRINKRTMRGREREIEQKRRRTKKRRIRSKNTLICYRFGDFRIAMVYIRTNSHTHNFDFYFILSIVVNKCGIEAHTNHSMNFDCFASNMIPSVKMLSHC